MKELVFDRKGLSELNIEFSIISLESSLFINRHSYVKLLFCQKHHGMGSEKTLINVDLCIVKGL